MSDFNASTSNCGNLNRHVSNEDQLLDQLRGLWIPHCRRDLEVRYHLGKLLNAKLGSPAVRQSYGIGTVERVSTELGIDKSDISRMRRFAARYQSFEEFHNKEPQATSWTKVRELVVREKSPNRPETDNRAVAGVLRSILSAVETLSRDVEPVGPSADRLCSALRELFSVASVRLNLPFDLKACENQQSDS